jgi:hypothetical protein
MTKPMDLFARLDTTSKKVPLLAQLSSDELATLDAAVAEAMRTEDEGFDKGLQEALRLVPRPLRSIARGLLFPGGTRG